MPAAATPESFTDFGSLLRYLRLRAQLSQRDLSIATGYSDAQISRLEQNRRSPDRMAVLARFLPALDLDADSELAARLLELADDVHHTGRGSSASPLEPSKLSHSPRPASNLPTLPTPLIGRAQDVAALRNLLLDDGVRLVTLVGPPGIGKTSLSIKMAADLLDHDVGRSHFAGGIWFVTLAPINRAELVLPAIGRILGVDDEADEALLTRLAAHVAAKPLLLALDNFEQVLAAASSVAELLAQCPGVKVLATSRAPLRIRGERQVPVPPLLVPKIEQLPGTEALREYAAVALFMERAREVKPDWVLTPANAPTVAAICASVDGLPLAIELVASRIKLLPPAEMLARLTSGRSTSPLQLLADGPRDLPARHQTLRSAIGWSYDLLTDDQQALLARLAIFRGGFTLEAVDAVCLDGPAPLSFEMVATLVDNSLVVQQEATDGTARFTLLEMIREYALERLIERGELETVHRRHAAYYLDLAATVDPKLRGPQQGAWLDRLEHEHNNFRSALEWALQQKETEMALRLSGVLTRFWGLHGHRREGQRWLMAALEQSTAQGERDALTPRYNAARANALLGASNLLSDRRAARRAAEEGLALYRELGDEQGSAYALHTLGVQARHLGELEEAEALHEASLGLSSKLEDPVGVYIALYNLAEIAQTRGDVQQAITLHEQSLVLKRQQGDSWSIAWSLVSLGLLAAMEGHRERARARYGESLQLRWELGDKTGLADALAGVASLTEEPEAAARLFGVVAGLLEEHGISLSPLIRGAHDRHQADIVSRLGGKAFDAAYIAGRAAPLDQVVAEVLSR